MLRTGAVRTLAVVLLAAASASSAFAAGDPTAGAAVFRRCSACHNVNSLAMKIGPGLKGLIGRKAGSVPNFPYSEAMRNSGLTWDEATLRRYLTDPKATVPGNKMSFGGVKDAKKLDDLLAYLEQATK